MFSQQPNPYMSLRLGAHLLEADQGVRFRVWAPDRKRLQVVFESGRGDVDMTAEAEGYFAAEVSGVGAGANYKFRLDGGEAYPDPASRYQPFGPHGYSQVVDPTAFSWTDGSWKGCSIEGQVIYEMHIGTFTQGGTWRAAAERLEYLRETGITVIEMMPVADFPGKFGWGYDGVQLYAPASIYGEPDDLRWFVDQAHAAGLSVILDVVYNHVGPDGNYLTKYASSYFSSKHMTDWGPGINYDAEGCQAVRDFFVENAAYWIREFHLDGLRLDATQDIHDDSEPHVLGQICQAAREAAGTRRIVLIGENEPQDTRLIQSIEKGGFGMDALWNDDFHHSATVAMTGKADAYYTDYRGRAQEFVAAMKHGYLYQGQWYRWQKKRRGSPTLGMPRTAMVTFIQNHDQVANSARGSRATETTSPGRLKAVTAVVLLGPGTPMLFQGQEFGASSRFLYFADHKPELAEMVSKGRIEFLSQWRSLRLSEMKSCFADPAKSETFEQCKLDFAEVETHAGMYALHRDLLRLRKQDPVISRQGADGFDGAVLTDHVFVLRYFSPGYDQDRLLVVNLGADLDMNPSPEPLLGPPLGKEWAKLWSSEDPGYGGCGTAPLDTEENWKIPGEAAVVLGPQKISRKSKSKRKLSR